jgi:hypothetical protein
VTLYELKEKRCPTQVQEWTFIIEVTPAVNRYGTFLAQLLDVISLFCVRIVVIHNNVVFARWLKVLSWTGLRLSFPIRVHGASPLRGPKKTGGITYFVSNVHVIFCTLLHLHFHFRVTRRLVRHI